MDFTEKLWDLAMAVAGFAVLQGIAFMNATTRDEFQNTLRRSPWTRRAACVVTLVFTPIYCFAVHWCHSNADYAMENKQKAWMVCRGQIAIVVLTGAAVLVVLYSFSRVKNRKSKNPSEPTV